MIQIPLNSSAIQFAFSSNIDLSDVTTFSLLYRKPDGAEGEWPADFDGTNIYKNFSETGDGLSELSQIGQWIAWPKLIFNDGRKLESSISFKFEVFKH